MVVCRTWRSGTDEQPLVTSMSKSSLNKSLTPEDRRKRDLGRIHALKKKVSDKNPAFDDGHYRDLVYQVGGVESSASLEPAERQELINRLSELAGETPHFTKGGRGGFKGRPKNMDNNESRADQLGKIEALLTVGKKSWAYADAIAKAVCKVDKVQWVETHDLYKVITALRMQAKRAGWDLQD